MCAIYVELLCAIRFGLDWTHDIFLACMSHVHAFSSIRTLISLYSYILMCLVLFYVSLFLPLSFFQLVASWYLNENPLHSSTFVILGHLFLLTLHLLMYSFVMIKLERNFRRTFVEEAFIWNAKSSYRIRGWGLGLGVIHSRGWGSLCDISVTCPSVIIHKFYSNMHRINTSVPHFFFHVRGTHIVVTPEIVFMILHVPRVAHPYYPGCEHLRIMSKDELLSRFYETPSSWGDH